MFGVRIVPVPQYCRLVANPEKIFITEDLTKTRQFIVKEVNTQKRDNKIHSFWTFDGRIFAKKGSKQFWIILTKKFGVLIGIDQIVNILNTLDELFSTVWILFLRKYGRQKSKTNGSYYLALDKLDIHVCIFLLPTSCISIYLYSHTAKYNGTEKNNNIIIT
jgi:hypothetical protein